MASVLATVYYFQSAGIVIKSLNLFLGWAMVQVLVGAPVVGPERDNRLKS